MIYTKHTWKHLNTRRSLSLTSHLGLFIRCSFSAENIHFFFFFYFFKFLCLYLKADFFLCNTVSSYDWILWRSVTDSHIAALRLQTQTTFCKTTEVNLFHCCTNRRLKYKRLCRSIIHICTITERLLSHTNAQLRSFDLLKMTPHVSSRSSLVLYTES